MQCTKCRQECFDHPLEYSKNRADAKKVLREENRGGPLTHRQIDEKLGDLMRRSQEIQQRPYREDSHDLRHILWNQKDIVRINIVIGWLIGFKMELEELGYTQEAEEGRHRKKDRYEPIAVE